MEVKKVSAKKRAKYVYILMILLLALIFPVMSRIHTKRTRQIEVLNELAEEHTMRPTKEFVFFEDEYVWNMNISLSDTGLSRMEAYRAEDEDSTNIEYYVSGYLLQDTDNVNQYHIFDDEAHKKYVGYIDIHKEGEVEHCDLYRPNYPVQCFLDINSAYNSLKD